MPLPTKTDSETDSEFISRCVVKVADEFPSFEQRVAVCYSQLEKTTMSKQKEDTFVIQPRRKENRGQYLKRCSANSKMREMYPMMKKRMGYCLNAYSEFYRWWGKFEDTDIPADSALGMCIARKRASGTDYKQAYRECASRVVVPNTPIVMSDDNLLIEPVEFSEMSVLGYQTKYFYICPGAQATFQHLMDMNPDDETAGMIRSAAQIADNVFEIEAKVLEDKTATTSQLNQAEILVDDFYDLMEEIDEELGMIHNVSYMDGHIELIESYIK